jgi:3-hydroxybenzoate 6-monooxygenase
VTESKENLETLVVGGGIGGLGAALALAGRGRPVHLVEAAPEFGEVGAGIQLAPNATRVLAELDVLERVAESAVRPRELVYMDAHSGERITAVDCGERFLERYGFPYLVVHRGDLHAALVAAARESSLITLETDRRVIAVEDGGAFASATCADGSEYRARALIGADGLHSVVRGTVADDRPVMSHYVAYRGTIPFAEVSPHAGADSMVMWVGREMHLVQYKLRGGELYNQVGVFRSDRAGEGEWGTPEELDARFATACETVRRGAALLDRAMRWPMFDREPTGNWTRNRSTLMGDAAHPMLQYIAQGGCQAIEDAAVLACHLGPDADVNEAFLAYQAERIPHTARVQRMARRWGRISHFGHVAAKIRNEVLSRRAGDDYTALDWLYAARSTGVGR